MDRKQRIDDLLAEILYIMCHRDVSTHRYELRRIGEELLFQSDECDLDEISARVKREWPCMAMVI